MPRSSSTGRCRKSTGSLVLLFILLSLIFVHGSAKTGYRKKPYPRKKKGSRTTSPPIAYNGSYYGDSNIFDVLSYGAKGDGTTDESKAFLAAWKVACRVESAVVQLPAEFCFFLNPISFVGPCQPNIVFQIDGTIIAPTNLAYGVQAYCSGFSSKNSKALPFREMALLMDTEQLGGGLRGIIWYLLIVKL